MTHIPALQTRNEAAMYLIVGMLRNQRNTYASVIEQLGGEAWNQFGNKDREIVEIIFSKGGKVEDRAELSRLLSTDAKKRLADINQKITLFAPTPEKIKAWCDDVHEGHLAEELMSKTKRLNDALTNGELPSKVLSEDVVTTTNLQVIKGGSVFVDAKSEAEIEIQRLDDWLSGKATDEIAPSHIPALDAKVGGWQTGINIVGGAPGSGKTALVLQSAYEHAREIKESGDEGCVVIFEGDTMKAGELFRREASRRARVNIRHLRDYTKPHLHTADKPTNLQIHNYRTELKAIPDLPVEISKRSNLTPSEIATYTHQAQAKHGKPKLIVFDHVETFCPDPNHGRVGEDNYLNAIYHGIASRLEAEGFDVPLLFVHHINRGSLRRPDPRPNNADLRYGGEGYAHLIIFPFLPHMFADVMKDELLEEYGGAQDRSMANIFVTKVRGDDSYMRVGQDAISYQGQYLSWEAPSNDQSIATA